MTPELMHAHQREAELRARAERYRVLREARDARAAASGGRARRGGARRRPARQDGGAPASP